MFIEINSHRIHYEFIHEELLHQNYLMVFLHEGLGSIPQWKSFPAEICSALQISGLIYERHGHGQSSTLKEARKPDYMHREAWEDLPELLKKLGQNQKSLLLTGHSDGATIALLYASKFPEKVAGIVSIAAHVVVEDCTVSGVQEAIRLYEEFDLKYLLEKYHGQNTDSMFYGWANAWISEDFRSWNILEEIKNIKSPLLLIQGERDEYASLKQVEIIGSLVKGECQRCIVPSSGHIPHLQQKEFVLKQVLNFYQIILQNKE